MQIKFTNKTIWAWNFVSHIECIIFLVNKIEIIIMLYYIIIPIK